MTSKTENSNFKKNLYNILDFINSLGKRDEVLTGCIEDRLTTSYEQYKNTLKLMYDYVLSRSNIKVLKTLTRINSRKRVEEDDSEFE